MTTDQLERAFRAADPTRADDALPPPAATVAAARALAEATAPDRSVVDRPAADPVRRRRTWVAVAAVAVVAAGLAVGIPLLDSRSTPSAQAAIRLAPFAGLMTPVVLAASPVGLGSASFFGEQGSTTAAYVPTTQGQDGVYVTHAATARGPQPGDLPHVEASTRQSDGSWVTVAGYGRFAVDATVRALLATTRAAPEASPLRVALAPSGWQLAAFKDLQPGEGVVTVSPDGTLDGADQISVIRYCTTATDFPAGYQDRGPTSTLDSLGRTGILMRGRDSWILQLRLDDAGSLVLLLPIRMDRDQVQQFADGVTVPT